MVKFCEKGATGNIFFIVAMASQELEGSGKDTLAIEMWDRVKKSGSYRNALGVISEYVELVECETENEACPAF